MKVTEQPSRYSDLEHTPTKLLLEEINREDQRVPRVVAGCIPAIAQLVDAIVERVRRGGRVFYAGSGTSGRLGVVDASEIPPTYGAEDDLFLAVIAGGDGAIRKAVEGAEDRPDAGWEDLQPYGPGPDDTFIGLTASGHTPYVLGALRRATEAGLLTACITCNPDTPAAEAATVPIVAVVGPEFVTGSTRMKAGTAEKLILNMISTSVMIRLGHVRGNRMVDMQLTNDKLVERGVRFVMEETGLKDEEAARTLLLEAGSVREAVQRYKRENNGTE